VTRTRPVGRQPERLRRPIHPLLRTWLPLAGLVVLLLGWRLGWLWPAAPLPAVQIVASDFAGILTLTNSGVTQEPPSLWLELEPTESSLGGRSAWLAAGVAPDRRTELAFRALIAGQAQLRWSDASGALLGIQPVALDRLWGGGGARVEVPWPALPASSPPGAIEVRLSF
jgi:hypothetical protein